MGLDKDGKENGLAVVPETGLPDYRNKKVLALLKETYAKGATNAEFAMYLAHAQSTGLNPFKKELWFIKTRGGVQLMTGINGFAAIANSNPEYDGIEVNTDYDESGKPIRSVALCYRKDRKFPSKGTAIFAEDKGQSPIWTTRPTVMLEKVAKARAWREAFPQQLNGIYSQEEIERENDTDDQNETDALNAAIFTEIETDPVDDNEATETADFIEAETVEIENA